MGALERLIGASSAPRPLGERVPLPKRAATWGLAIAGPVLITLMARLIGPSLPPATIMFATLALVALVALVGGARPALTATITGLAAQEVLFSFPYGALDDHRPAQFSVLAIFVGLGAGLGIMVDELKRVSAEQAALRRIATLVAHGTAPPALFATVADEVAAHLGADLATVGQLGPDGVVTIRAAGGPRMDEVAAGDRWPVEPPLALAAVVRTRRAARSDDYEAAATALHKRLRGLGIRSSLATPVIVGGRVWGVIVASGQRRHLPRDAERRMLDFTELVGIAIADAEARGELAASRARIVAAADEARRRIERDLHDGVQQRLVSLALEVRTAQAGLGPGAGEVSEELSQVVDGLKGALDELREIARGIHPSILTEGGLGPALRTLARRAPLPVTLDVHIDDALSDGVEVATYYAVSEMMTNTAKHARASHCEVTVTAGDGVLRLLARDDGVGGADPGRGSGLVGLRDRVEALAGTMSVSSPPGEGTTIEVALPLAEHQVNGHASTI